MKDNELKIGQPVYKIEQHGKISLRRPKLSKEEVKRLMKKKKKKKKKKMIDNDSIREVDALNP